MEGSGLQAGVPMPVIVQGPKETQDGVEGSVSRSLAHLFSFIKLQARGHSACGPCDAGARPHPPLSTEKEQAPPAHPYLIILWSI